MKTNKHLKTCPSLDNVASTLRPPALSGEVAAHQGAATMFTKCLFGNKWLAPYLAASWARV